MPRIKKEPIPFYLRNHCRRRDLLSIKAYNGFKVGDKVISNHYSLYGPTRIIAFAAVWGDPLDIRAVVYYPTQLESGYFGNGYFVLFTTDIQIVEE